MCERKMVMRIKLTIAMGVLFAVTLAFAGLSARAMLEKGTRALDFELPSVSGKKVKLSELAKDPHRKGARRVVLLNFWATWCPPCRAEVPYLQKLHQRYGKKGLVVVGISMDTQGAAAVRPFVKERKLTYVQLLDPRRTVAQRYKVGPIPTTYIIDRSGVIRKVRLGFAPGLEKHLEEDIKALLQQAQLGKQD